MPTENKGDGSKIMYNKGPYLDKTSKILITSWKYIIQDRDKKIEIKNTKIHEAPSCFVGKINKTEKLWATRTKRVRQFKLISGEINYYNSNEWNSELLQSI